MQTEERRMEDRAKAQPFSGLVASVTLHIVESTFRKCVEKLETVL